MRVLKVRLKKNVRDMAGNRYSEGSLHDVVFALDGVPEVVGAWYLPLGKDKWEPALTAEVLGRLLGEGRDEGAGCGGPGADKRRRRGPA